MPFPPELASRVDAMRAKLGGGDESVAGEQSNSLRVKLAKREGAGGFTANVAALRAEIAKENDNDS